MDIQVRELIDRIKKDGVEAATREAAGIRQEAEAEARRVLEAAKKEASRITEKALRDAERSEKAGVAALEQASRNLVLVFKGEIQALLDKIVTRQLDKSYDDDVLRTVIPQMLSAWNPKAQGSLDVLLGESSLGKLRTFFEGKLAKELKKGLELRPEGSLSGGFRIARKDGSVYYDFSAESVAEMLCAYLNPRLAEILSASVKDEQEG